MYKTFECRECGNDTRYIYRVVGLDNKKRPEKKRFVKRFVTNVMKKRCDLDAEVSNE